jgi:hypothetical protein
MPAYLADQAKTVLRIVNVPPLITGSSAGGCGRPKV